jgi:hypothetical protein
VPKALNIFLPFKNHYPAPWPDLIQRGQMVYFQTSFGTFWKASEWKILISFLAIWYTLRTFAFIFWSFGVYFGPLLFYPHFDIILVSKVKSVNPDLI